MPAREIEAALTLCRVLSVQPAVEGLWDVLARVLAQYVTTDNACLARVGEPSSALRGRAAPAQAAGLPFLQLATYLIIGVSSWQ